jgi:hypothetical protein
MYHKHEALSELREVKSHAMHRVLLRRVILNAAACFVETLQKLCIAQVQVNAHAALSAEEKPLLQRHFSVPQLQRFELRLQELR